MMPNTTLGVMNIRSVLLVSVCLLPAQLWASDNVKAYRGHLFIDPEVEVFRPCGSDTPLWLSYKADDWKELAEQHWKFRKKPYDSSYLVAKGTIGPKLDCGFCENYEGSFNLIEVIEHRATTSKDCEQ